MQRLHDYFPSKIKESLTALNMLITCFRETGHNWTLMQLAALFAETIKIKQDLMRDGYELHQLETGEYMACMTNNAILVRTAFLFNELATENIPDDLLMTADVLIAMKASPSLEDAKNIVMNRARSLQQGKHVFFPPPLIEEIVVQSQKLVSKP